MNNIHVLFDGRLICAKMNGRSRHLVNLINGLNKVAPNNKYSVIISTDDAFEHLGDKIDIIKSKVPFRSYNELFELPKLIKSIKPDIFHNPACTPIIPLSGIPYVISVHDLDGLDSFSSSVQNYLNKYLVRFACRRADSVLTVSEYSKEQLTEHLGIRESHIDVVYNGIEDRFFLPLDVERSKEIKNKYSLPNDYILYVGDNSERKNVKGIIQSYIKSNVEASLVLTLSYEEIKNYIDDKQKTKNIICIGSIPNTELRYLYNMAKIFMFPSFKEGFGLPVIEAFASGVPVITSNMTSLPEISKGAAVTVDPHDIASIASAIKIVLTDEDLRKRNIRDGLEVSKYLTVEKMAQRVLEIYKRILK